MAIYWELPYLWDVFNQEMFFMGKVDFRTVKTKNLRNPCDRATLKLGVWSAETGLRHAYKA